MEKWSFLNKNHELTPCKNVNFSTFWTCCFYSLEMSFFVLEYRKRHFSCLYFLKKKFGIMVIFGQKPWINPFVKMSIFRLFLTSCFYSLEGRSFVLEYRERHFPCLYCLKKQVGKMVIFEQKPWVNPFVKMSIFRLFQLVAFIA